MAVLWNGSVEPTNAIDGDMCLHQDDAQHGWAKRYQRHRQMWAGDLAEAETAYLDELTTLEREVVLERGSAVDVAAMPNPHNHDP